MHNLQAYIKHSQNDKESKTKIMKLKKLFSDHKNIFINNKFNDLYIKTKEIELLRNKQFF